MNEPDGRAGDRYEQEALTCPVCGTKFFATADSAVLSSLSPAQSCCGAELQRLGNRVQDVALPTALREADGGSQVRRFENYEVVLDADGKPIELGRGAMGVTYKAFDVDLHCPVTLKVISERYLGDESAQLRFLCEARAAARLRHSNVASVLHLGRTGRVTSMPWSLSREKRLRISSSARADWK